jgi:hypothetical protein
MSYTNPHKVNSSGQYTVCQGLTVIFPIQGAQRWHDLADSIEFPYAPLPPNSYHITLLDICTAQDVLGDQNPPESKWNKYVQEMSPLLLQASRHLEASTLDPQFTVSEIRVSRRYVKLILECKEQENEIQLLRAQLAKILGIKPDILVPHITLGYNYTTSDITQKIIDRHINAIPLLNCTISGIMPARLCSFNDMTAFKPFVATTFV